MVFLFFVQEAWASLRRNPAASLAAVTAIYAVLFLLSLLMLLSHNILSLADGLRDRKGLSVFLESNVSEDRLAELEMHFSRFSEVAEIQLVDRGAALADLESELGADDIAGTLGGNPLPDVFLITPNSDSGDAATLKRLATEMEAYEGVEDVLFGERWVEALDYGLRVVTRANALTGFLATLAIVLVLGNTLRLIVLMREEPLAIMKMIGATDTFIRMPFVVAGVLLSLVGAGISLATLYGGYQLGNQLLPGMHFLPVSSLVMFLVGITLIGIAGSLLTVEISIRHLEKRKGRYRA
jgi:cell division transport system permease protein